MNAIAKTALAQALIYYVVFQPVDDSHGFARELSIPGPNMWDVTAYMNAQTEQDRQDLLDGKGLLVFMDMTNTPDWVLDWDGDYQMEVRTASQDQVIGSLLPPRTRYIASFRPQADQGGNVIPVDPRGETEFEVTSIIESASEDVREQMLAGGNELSDSLRVADNVPKWVRKWDGPFEVDVSVYEPYDTLPASFVREPQLKAIVIRPDTRYIARFIPMGRSVEDDGEEIEIQPIGPDQWDVTDYFAGKSADEVLWIVGSSEQRRKLAHHGEPYWVTRWNAPFAVEIDVYAAEDAHELEQVRQSNRFYDPGKLTQLPFSLKASIPDSDGRYGRGVRDGIEALSLALYQAGVDLSVIQRAALVAAEGYGNNGDSVRDQLEEMLVVSMEHIDGYERAIEDMDDMKRLGIPHLIPSMQGFRNLLMYIPGEEDMTHEQLIADLEGMTSGGFLMAIKRAIEIGAQYVYFDADVPALDGWPTYDDDGNSEIRNA